MPIQSPFLAVKAGLRRQTGIRLYLNLICAMQFISGTWEIFGKKIETSLSIGSQSEHIFYTQYRCLKCCRAFLFKVITVVRTITTFKPFSVLQLNCKLSIFQRDAKNGFKFWFKKLCFLISLHVIQQCCIRRYSEL